MSNFATMLKDENNKTKTLTENLAVAYETSGKYLLDFNFKLSQYRNMNIEDIKNDFAKVFFEDSLIATKFVFFVGDVRGGLGERKVFRACIEWLADNKPEIAIAVLGLIPEYTRWDNLIGLVLHDKVGDVALNYVCQQFNYDVMAMTQNQPISLLGKWMPSINASSKDTVRLAYYICGRTNTTPKNYRQTLSALRKYLDVVEVKMSAKEWGKINYESVPSLANLKYASAFLKNDGERRREYLASLQKGETKINASVSQPHEVVRAYMNYDRAKDYDVALEEIWKALPDVCVENSLVVRDGSYSMTCSAGSGKTTCLDIATALAIYCSEHNSEEWKNKFITFSSRPKFVDLSGCKTLRDKLVRCSAETDCSNTNIEATMKLILDTAINNNCSQEDMPKNIIIISDMQFDARYGGQFNWNKSLFDQIVDDYAEHGYKLPKIIFWNVCSRNIDTIPMQNNELGLILCSGFSTTNMKMFMSGEINPYKVLLEQLNNERYDIIEQLVGELLKTEVKQTN